MNETPVIRLKGLTKYFQTRSLFKTERVAAVDGLDLEVRSGEIFGLLGPNGAGKTTTINLIIGIAVPTSGKIELFGSPFWAGNVAPLGHIGYVPEATFLPEYFTVAELLEFYAQLYFIPWRVIRQRIGELLDKVGLSKERRTPLKQLSMGQRRLVDIAQALIHDPDLIILDEPTVYLDPLILDRFRTILRELKARGKTILMSSHMLSEIEKLSDRIAILDKGRCLKIETREEFSREGSLEESFLKLVRHEH